MGPAVLVRSDASLREVACVLLSRGVASGSSLRRCTLSHRGRGHGHAGVAVGMLGRRDLLRLLADASHPAVDVTPQAAVELDSKAALAAPPTTGLR
jgi:hypothetical protein